MSAIYLAIASTEYYGFDVICAFEDQAAADALVAACNAYPRTCDARFPDITLADDEFEAMEREYDKARESWAAQHPAGRDLAGRDSYSVIEAELRTAIGRKP